jgi:uncharacterized protein (DUF2235 family)
MKRIILCSDGTGNIGGKGRGTNVWKIYKALDRRGHERTPAGGPEQIAFHDDGVGTSDFKVFKMLGGLVGWGLGRNIRDLYTALASCYRPGDKLYLFGFSRGAFTIRSLAGMISRCGIADRNQLGEDLLEDRVAQAYRCYRKAPERSAEFRAKYAVQHPTLTPDGRVPIQFVGVWDTVDAIGVPFDWMRTLIYAVARHVRRPHDHDINHDMVYGYHAIAVDDERRTFDPVMWDEHKATPNQIIQQAWFAGVHSNVGGGYPRQGMSALTLDWMMEMAEHAEPDAEDHGLRFTAYDRQQARNEADVHARLYDSRAGMAAYFRYRPRAIEETCRTYCLGKPKVHVSALQRIERSVESYAPGVLPIDFDIVTTESHLQPVAQAFAERLAATRDQRIAARGRYGRLVRMRVIFYHVFVGITILAASLSVYFRLADGSDRLPSFAGFFPSFNAAISTPAEDAPFLLEAASRAYHLVPAIANAAIPASWEGFINGLFDRPDLVLLIAGTLAVLLYWRQRVMRSMRLIVQRTWKAVFSETS